MQLTAQIRFPIVKSRLWLFLIASLLVFGFPETVPAQTPPPPAATDLTALYTEGTNAFQAGDYAKAASTLESLIAKSTPESPLESVYYLVGASYFNLQNYQKAASTLTTFLTKYPKSPQVGDAAFFLGQSLLKLGKKEEALAAYKRLENDPKWRDQVLLLRGNLLKETGKLDEAISTLESLTKDGLRTPEAAQAALFLAGAYAEKKQPEKTASILDVIRKNKSMVEDLAELNALATKMGDGLLEKGNSREALVCYQMVEPKSGLIAHQEAMITRDKAKIEQNLAAVREDPRRVPEILPQNKELQAKVAKLEAELPALEKYPDISRPIYVRMARAYYGMGRKWEAITIYDELLRSGDAASRESDLFSILVTSIETNRFAQAMQYAQDYLKEFPSGPNAAIAGYLFGVAALETGDETTAQSHFGKIIESQPSHQFGEDMLLLLANSRFSQGNFEASLEAYKKYASTYPKGKYLEEVEYRRALASLFAGKYEEALKALQGFMAKYPKSNFVPDARYRLAVCKYAASLYEEVTADCNAWEKDYGTGTPPFAEVASLKGDCLAALGRNDEAITAYTAAYKAASSDEVLNYALFEAAKLRQKRGEWDQIAKMFEEFVADHPDHPTVVPSAYWIGRARTKMGKPEEAKQYVAKVVQENIANPKKDAVEQLLNQLAQLCVRKKPAAAASPSPAGQEKEAPTKPPADQDPGAELDILLSARTQQSPTAKARILFAKAELGRLRRNPIEEEKNLMGIAATFKVEDLSAVILARVGDLLLAKGQNEKAEQYFQRLKSEYPKSDYVDFAYNGLAEIAYRKGDYSKALSIFDEGIDKGVAGQKLKDFTVGRAKCLLALGRFDDAKKLFEQVASVREWRGESTAQSVYSLGEIEEKKGNLAEAISYYQRVYVAYGRFLPWVAKAYIRSAECFEKLGKSEEALNTYRELLRNEKLSSFAEYEQARKHAGGEGG